MHILALLNCLISCKMINSEAEVGWFPGRGPKYQRSKYQWIKIPTNPIKTPTDPIKIPESIKLKENILASYCSNGPVGIIKSFCPLINPYDCHPIGIWSKCKGILTSAKNLNFHFAFFLFLLCFRLEICFGLKCRMQSGSLFPCPIIPNQFFPWHPPPGSLTGSPSAASSKYLPPVQALSVLLYWMVQT